MIKSHIRQYLFWAIVFNFIFFFFKLFLYAKKVDATPFEQIVFFGNPNQLDTSVVSFNPRQAYGSFCFSQDSGLTVVCARKYRVVAIIEFESRASTRITAIERRLEFPCEKGRLYSDRYEFNADGSLVLVSARNISRWELEGSWNPLFKRHWEWEW